MLTRAPRPVAVADWRSDAFRVIAPAGTPVPPVAAAARHGLPGGEGGTWVCVATPVHMRAGMSSVTLPPDGILDLQLPEAAQLAAGYNRTFAGSWPRLVVGRTGVLLAEFDKPLAALTHDPERVRGGDPFGALPSGADGPRLRRVMSEIEMWLFGHEVNLARQAQALQPITGLWLWGGGPTAARLPSVFGWTAGRDPLFCAFRDVADWPGEGGPGVVVCDAEPGSQDWVEIERRWLDPAVAALRAGRIGRLEFSAAALRYGIGPGARLRFWRRAKPWWESFGLSQGESNDLQ